jgi:hypothetical protein
VSLIRCNLALRRPDGILGDARGDRRLGSNPRQSMAGEHIGLVVEVADILRPSTIMHPGQVDLGLRESRCRRSMVRVTLPDAPVGSVLGNTEHQVPQPVLLKALLDGLRRRIAVPARWVMTWHSSSASIPPSSWREAGGGCVPIELSHRDFRLELAARAAQHIGEGAVPAFLKGLLCNDRADAVRR